MVVTRNPAKGWPARPRGVHRCDYSVENFLEPHLSTKNVYTGGHSESLVSLP